MSQSSLSGREPSLPFEPDRTGDEPSLGGESFLAEIQTALHSSDTALHRSALTRLSQINTPGALDILLEQLSHPSPHARSTTIALLMKHQPPQAVPALIEAIRAEDDRLQTRYDAGTRLSILHSGDEEQFYNTAGEYGLLSLMVHALGICAAHADDMLREHAAIFVASLLQRDLARYDSELRSFGIDGLWNLGREYAQALNLMCVGLLHYTTALRSTPHPVAVPALLEALWHMDPHITGTAASTLNDIYERYPDPALRQQIVAGALDGLRSTDLRPRHNAAYILVQRGAEVIPQLTALLTHPDPMNRRGAVMALSQFLKGPDPVIAEPKMTEHTIGLMAACLDDPNPDVRLAAAEAFEVLAQNIDTRLLETVVPALSRLLPDTYRDEHGTIGDRAAHALMLIGTPEALAALAANRSSDSM